MSFAGSLLSDRAGAGTIHRMVNRHRFVFSAPFFLFFVVGTTILAAGCRSNRRDAAPILFLRPDDTGHAQLFLLPAPDGTPRALTEAARGPGLDVIDFAVSPGASAIAYSAFVDTGGTALRLVSANGRDDRLVLDCPSDECSGVVWSPDGRRLVYERRALRDGRAGQPRLYWLDLDTGETRPLVEGDDTPNYGAVFSPDGNWLSYVSPANEGIVLYHLADGRQRLLPSRAGRPAAWSPDSADVVIGDLVVSGTIIAPGGEDVPETGQESSAVYLYRVSLADEGSRQRLSPEASIEDSVPSWSPDGQWIAFGRRPAQTVTGRQLWLMRADGSDARSLTNEPSVFHGPPNWSPDGRFLLFQRYDPSDPAGASSVWLLDVQAGELVQVIDTAFQPAWLSGQTGKEAINE